MNRNRSGPVFLDSLLTDLILKCVRTVGRAVVKSMQHGAMGMDRALAASRGTSRSNAAAWIGGVEAISVTMPWAASLDYQELKPSLCRENGVRDFSQVL